MGASASVNNDGLDESDLCDRSKAELLAHMKVSEGRGCGVEGGTVRVRIAFEMLPCSLDKRDEYWVRLFVNVRERNLNGYHLGTLID